MGVTVIKKNKVVPVQGRAGQPGGGGERDKPDRANEHSQHGHKQQNVGLGI